MEGYISADSPQYFAFNIWDIDSARAVMDAARRTGHDVVLQTSAKIFGDMDRELIRWYVTHYSERQGIQAWLHLDHSASLAQIEEAAGNGWDSVMLDASDRPVEENIRLTNEACALVKGKGVLVEAEIGHVGRTDEGMTVGEAGIAEIKGIRKFIRDTEADMLAVAIGTAHGRYHGSPALHYGILEETGKISPLPLVIHGGSGLDDGTLLALLSYKNVKKINLSTEVKESYRKGIMESMKRGYLEEEGFDPLRTKGVSHDVLEEMAAGKMRLLES